MWIAQNKLWNTKGGHFRKKAMRFMASLPLVLTILLASCAAYGAYHPNTSNESLNSVRGPADGRYKLAFIEFGDQGSALDTSQRTAALSMIQQAQRPLLFVYIHGWQNNANSADVCRFEHFIDTVSRYPEITGRKINVLGVYIAWRGEDVTLPVAKFLTFWSRKGAGGTIAAQNGCLATISELALAARAPEKKYHHCVLLGHSFGGLVLENTISHSILDAGSTGSRNTSPWDMAVAFNAADSSIGSRQLMSELDYLYKYDPVRHAYIGRSAGAEHGSAVPQNRPFLIILQSENDVATGQFFPIGTGLYNLVGLRAHWDRVPVPGSNGQKVSESEFYTHTPGNNKYLVNYHFVLQGETTPPRVCEPLRTGRSKPISEKTTQTIPSIRASITTATKIASAATLTIIPTRSAQLRETKFGDDGNLFIPATTACPAGSCVCRKRLYGATADCGATTPSLCSALFSACNSRCPPEVS